MNSFDLQKEIDRNESDKQMVKAELEAYQKKWAEYVMANKEEICRTHKPIVVKKKLKARCSEFIDKLKTVLGLKPRKERLDGIEAYLQYSDEP